jgi:hypothetical protein
MGAWGYGIKENDAAMDMMSDFESIVIYDSNYGRQHPEYQDLPFSEKISYVIDELINHCRDSEEEGHFRAVGFQALACLIMEHGSAVTPIQWQTISYECVQCPEYQLAQQLSNQGHGVISSQAMLNHGFEDDMWGIEAHQKRLEGRLDAINDFAKIMKNYPIDGGHIQSIEHTGLIETMIQAQHKPKF